MRSSVQHWCVSVAIGCALGFAACAKHEAKSGHAEHPAEVEKIEGSELSRVTLSEKAIDRIDLQTALVREQAVEGGMLKIVPYSSLLYDNQGRTWIYTSPQPRTFVRAQVQVDRIEGDEVWLREGPAAGVAVASVGVAQLYGEETGVGH
jgi:hypothetical protein